MFSLKFILLYFVAFFIYLSFKLSLFMRFVNYGKKLADSDDAKKDYKKRQEIKKIVNEISDIELRMWYEDSVFKKVSGIEYSRHIAITKYEIFLEKNDKYIYHKPLTKKPDIRNEIPQKDTADDEDNDNKPLFTIKYKK